MPLDPETIRKPLRKLRKFLQFSYKSALPDDVHRLRTMARRTEAIVHGLAWDKRRKTSHVLKTLAPVRKAAGKVRDMDVLIGLASTLDRESEEDCQIQLLERLGEKRAKAAVKLQQIVGKQETAASRDLKLCLKVLEKQMDAPGKQALPLPAGATAVSLRLATELDAWPKLNRKNIHPFRLKLKELRYILQLAPDRDANFVVALGEVKDSIGAWHDWCELAAIAKKTLKHGSGCQLLRQIASKQSSQFDKALADANALRNQYLHSDRTAAHPAKKEPAGVKMPVLETASNLAS